MKQLEYKIINKDNLAYALRIQNTIFPTDSAEEEYNDSINGSISHPLMLNYLVYDLSISKDEAIGIGGIYKCKEYEDDAWLGYFGVLDSQRKQGYGSQIILDMEKIAKDKGFSHLRLYTNKAMYPIGYIFYEKMGYIAERYTNFKKPHCKEIMDEEYIFSKNIDNTKYVKWGNRYIEDIDKYD